MVIYRGISIGSHPKDQEVLDIFNRWNFNTATIEMFYSEVLNAHDGYIYESKLHEMRGTADLLIANDMKPIIGMRVSHFGDHGGWTHDYVNLTSEGRGKISDFLPILAQWFPDCIICPYHYPYHGEEDYDYNRINTLHNVTLPEFVSAIRSQTNQPIIFSPFTQGKLYYDANTRLNKR